MWAKNLTTLLTGIAAGTVVGMLFAPEKGNVSRDRIYKKGDQLINDLEDKISELRRNSKAYLDNAEDHAMDLTEKGRQQAEQSINRVADEVEDKAEDAEAAINKRREEN